MPIHEVVDVVAVRHGVVPAVRAVNVIRCVPLALMIGRAAVRVIRIHCDRGLVDVITVYRVQVAVV